MQLMAPFLVDFFTPLKLCFKGHFKDVRASPLLLLPDSALIVLFPKELRSSLEGVSCFQSLSFGHPRNTAHKIKLKHGRYFFVQFIMSKDV